MSMLTKIEAVKIVHSPWESNVKVVDILDYLKWSEEEKKCIIIRDYRMSNGIKVLSEKEHVVRVLLNTIMDESHLEIDTFELELKTFADWAMLVNHYLKPKGIKKCESQKGTQRDSSNYASNTSTSRNHNNILATSTTSEADSEDSETSFPCIQGTSSHTVDRNLIGATLYINKGYPDIYDFFSWEGDVSCNSLKKSQKKCCRIGKYKIAVFDNDIHSISELYPKSTLSSSSTGNFKVEKNIIYLSPGTPISRIGNADLTTYEGFHNFMTENYY